MLIEGSPLGCSWLSFGVLLALLCSILGVLILRSIFAPFMQLSITFARILSGIILFSSVFDFNFRFILSVPLEPPLKVNISFQFLFSTCFGAVCRKNCWYCSSAFDLSLCCFLFWFPSLKFALRLARLHLEWRLVFVCVLIFVDWSKTSQKDVLVYMCWVFCICYQIW